MVTAFSSWSRTCFSTSCASAERDVLALQRRVGDQADERALELADVRLDLAGDVERDVVGQRDRLGLGLLLEDRDLRLEVRRLDVGDEAPLEPRAQPLLERRDLARRAVAADDDLLLRVEERVERVEELGLRAFHARQELDVVHQQHVHGPVALAELVDAVVLHRVHHLVLEPLGRDVGEVHLRVVAEHVVPDGVHQVRLAEPHAAVDEQRVVRARRRLGHRAAGGLGELVGRSDDEGVERVARVQAAQRGDRRERRIGPGRVLPAGRRRLVGRPSSSSRAR